MPDKINIQKYVRKGEYSSEIEDSTNKLSKILDHTKPKFDQSLSKEAQTSNPLASHMYLRID